MTITFTEAAGGPVPAVEIEINLQGAGGLPSGDEIRNIIVVAERVAAGTSSANAVNSTPFADADAAQTWFGAGSPGDCMCQQIFAYRNSKTGAAKAQVYGAAIAEKATGTAANQTLTFATNASGNGTWIFSVGGHQVSVTVSTGDTPTLQAAALEAAWDALSWANKPPIEIGVAAGVATFTCSVKGTHINNVALETIQDPGIATTATWGGTTMGAGATAGAGPQLVADYATLIANLASFTDAGQYVIPWAEAGNAAAKSFDDDAAETWIDHVNDRGDATNMVPATLIMAYKDTAANIVAAVTGFDSDDSERVNLLGHPYSATGGSGTWEGELAAQFAAMRASEQHFARSLDGLAFRNLQAPNASDNWTHAEQKTLIEGGVSPAYLPKGSSDVSLVRCIMARTGFGVVDGTIMDSLDYVRESCEAKLLASIDRFSIVDDDEEPPPVEHITQPAAIKALLRGVFVDLQNAGYITNLADNWDNVVVNLSGNTIQLSIPTDIVPQLHNIQVRLDATV